MFETVDHDFGPVAHGATVEYAFKLTNSFQESVHIASVRSSCGCTTPRIVKDTLKTYEAGAIVAAFNTRAFNGHKSATITVTFDRPFYAEVQLQVAGEIRTDVSLSPGGIEFGSIDHSSTSSTSAEKAPEKNNAKPIERKLIVTYAGPNDWKIVEVRPSSEFLSAAVRETNRAPGRTTYELTVGLKPGAAAGSLKEQVILLTNDPEVSEVPVDVEGRIVAAVTVSPASLFIGSVAPGQTVTKQLVIQAKRPFRIVKIRCDDPSFSFPTSTAVKTVHLVPVTFRPDDTPGKVVRRIHITTDLGDDGAIEVAAYAQILEAVKN